LSPVAARLLSVDRLLLHGGHGPHTRRPDADVAKQRTVSYLSCRGRGNRCFCRLELITIVTPLSRPSSAKNGRFSRPLQCILETRKITVHSRVRADIKCADRPQCRPIVRPRPTAGLWTPILSIRSAIASLRRAVRLLFERWATAPETRPLPAISRAHPASDVNRLSLSSGVRRGEAMIPRPVVRGPMAVALPRSRSPYPLPGRFGCANCRLC